MAKDQRHQVTKAHRLRIQFLRQQEKEWLEAEQRRMLKRLAKAK